MTKYHLGKSSVRRLKTCHPDLIVLVNSAIENSPLDFSVVCGYRSEEDQEAAFKAGNSKAHFGESPHNCEPALAVDLVPWVDGKLVWDSDSEHYAELGKHLSVTAKSLYDSGAIENNIEWALKQWGWDAPHWQIRGWKALKP